MTTTARTAAALAFLAGIGTATLAAAPAAADHRPSFCADTSDLPRTADAAEAWLRACAVADPLPRTADALDKIDGNSDPATGLPEGADSAERWLAGH